MVVNDSASGTSTTDEGKTSRSETRTSLNHTVAFTVTTNGVVANVTYELKSKVDSQLLYDSHRSLAVLSDGTAMDWGTSGHYETGRGGNATAPGLVKGLTDVVSIAASPWGSAAVLASGRIMTWSEVRPWHRPGFNGTANLSPLPILLWLDGLEQP